MLLHIEIDRLLHRVAEAGERSGVMQDDADLDDVFGARWHSGDDDKRRERSGRKFQTAHVSSPGRALAARYTIIARKCDGDNGSPCAAAPAVGPCPKRRSQKPRPALRNSISSAVEGRPRMALRWGKRPKRSTTSWCRRA